MRLLLLCLLAFTIGAFAWTKDDHEIFDLVSALEASEGKGTTFYSHLGVDIGASTSEISKAYRKKSIELHPDKNPGVKDIQQRFARLGVISQILRSPEKRERYNFFYKNGVPAWRGTGYYYSRFRPGLLTTLTFLVILTSALHLLVLKLNYNRDRRRVEYFQRTARSSAGVSGSSTPTGKKGGAGVGDKDVSDLVRAATAKAQVGRRRKVKVPMVEGSEMGGQLELIVEGEHVFLPHDDGSLTPLSDLATPPSLLQAWPIRLSRIAYHRLLASLPPSIQATLAFPSRNTAALSQAANDDEEEDDGGESSGPDDTPTPGPRSRAAQMRRERLAGGGGGKKGRSSTPQESGADSELDGGDGADGGGGGEGGAGAEESKRKKKAMGKAGGMRRRKMGMKR